MALVLAIVGVACVAYGVCVMRVRSGSSFFLVWYVLGALLLAAAAATHAGVWEYLPGEVRCVGLALLAVVAVAFCVALGCIAWGARAEGADGLDCIIVLGAQVRPDGTPCVALRCRLDAALAYLRRNPATRCIVSGGRGANEPVTEAACMASYLVERGVPAERILQEGASTSTKENIGNSFAFVDPRADAVGIVTSGFHVFRATRIARKAGIARVWGIAAKSSAFFLPSNVLRECMGLAKDFLAGNL